MKIAVVGIDFPLGKKNLADERLDKLRDIFHPPKVTYLQIEFLDETQIKEADAVLCEAKAKLDLILEDLELIESRLQAEPENALFLRSKEAIEKETLLNEVPFSEEEQKLLFGQNLITLKPVILADKDNLAPQPELMRQAYAGCGMISFFTVNERELRAWSLKKGATVYEAAGSIHSDLERGFIKAEAIGYEDLVKAGSLNAAKAKGLVRLEDKGYIVKDGDLIQIRFNV
jgi:hypothetical protein